MLQGIYMLLFRLDKFSSVSAKNPPNFHSKNPPKLHLKPGSHCAILATICSSETNFENPKRFL